MSGRQDLNDFELVNQALSGQRRIDEQVFCSVAVLANRLDCLKASCPGMFEGIGFSEHFQELAERELISSIS